MSNLPSIFGDVGNLTEPITKLVESVADAIGVLYEPTRIVKKAKADAEERQEEILRTV